MKNGPLSLLFHVLFVAFLLAPMVLVCLVAFTPHGFLSLPTDGFSLRWFRRLSAYPEFLRAFGNSVLIAGCPRPLPCSSRCRQRSRLPVIAFWDVKC